jgi:hypothetical protein
LQLTYSFDTNKESPEIIMELLLSEICHISLSMANREKRNGASLYQQKHILGTQKTSERKKNLSDLNITIPEHFKQDFDIDDVFHVENRYLVLGVGDLTANLFRPSFDASWKKPLFFLDYEPIEEKEYYGFIVQGEKDETIVRIEKIIFQDGIPLENGKRIDHLKWLFCSTPLVYKENVVNVSEMVLNDYDLRHTFGKSAKEFTDKLYFQLRASYKDFVEMVKKNESRILTTGPEVEFYHAGIGVKEDKILVIHHIGSLRELALKFKELGVKDAVLLDSGGSSVIWANWNMGGTIAHHVNYRPKRGAIIIIEIKRNQEHS